jgi:hypothetical protein
MHSEWKVTSNRINGETMYGVYRLKNKLDVDHSGNREYHGGYVSSREAAATVAAELNKKMEETK